VVYLTHQLLMNLLIGSVDHRDASRKESQEREKLATQVSVLLTLGSTRKILNLLEFLHGIKQDINIMDNLS